MPQLLSTHVAPIPSLEKRYVRAERLTSALIRFN